MANPAGTGNTNRKKAPSDPRTKGKATTAKAPGKATTKQPDRRLEPIRTLLESQKDTPLPSIIAESATAMLNATSLLRQKRSGVLKLRTNDDLFPNSTNIKSKLVIPKSLIKDATSIARSERVEALTQQYKTDMKKVIVDQAEVNAWHQEDERLNEFITHTKQIATACATTARFTMFQETDKTIIPDDKLGIGALWCYFHNLAETHIFFTEYLLTTRKELCARFWDEFKTPECKSYLLRDNLHSLRGDCTSVTILENDISELKTFNLQSSITRTWRYDHQLPTENVTEGQQQAQQPDTNQVEDTTTATQSYDFYTDTNKACIKETVKLLASILENAFLVVEKHQIRNIMQQKMAAKIKADRKETKTHSLANKLHANLDAETSVLPENMSQLVAKTVAEKFKIEQKKAQRKKSSGGTTDTVAHPNVQGNGNNSNKSSNKRQHFPTQQQQPQQHHKRPRHTPPVRAYQGRGTPPRGRGSSRGRGRERAPTHHNPYNSTTSSGRATRGRGRGRTSPRGGRPHRGGRGGRQPGRGRGGRY